MLYLVNLILFVLPNILYYQNKTTILKMYCCLIILQLISLLLNYFQTNIYMSSVLNYDRPFSFKDVNGITGTVILADSIKTPSITTSAIRVSNGYGSTGNILSTTGSDLAWIAPPTFNNNVNSNITINNLTNANSITCSTLNATNTNSTNTTFTNQVTFSTLPPTSITPTIPSHVSTKGYVDTLVPNGIYTMFLNFSQSTTVNSVPYKISSNIVSTIISSTPIQTIVPANTVSPTIPFATFITNKINITQILPSLLTVNIYGKSSANLNTQYLVKLKKISGTTITPIGISTGSESSTILFTAATTPRMHTIVLDVPSTPTTIDDMLILELFIINKSTSSVTISTYFENPYYSYAQFQSNTLNPLQSYTHINSADLNMNSYDIISTTNMTISNNSTTIPFLLGSGASTINIGTDTTTKTINLLNTPNSASTININSPVSLEYSVPVPSGYIGQYVSNPTLTGDTSFIGGICSKNCNLPSKGTWMISAMGGVICATQGIIKTLGFQFNDGPLGSTTYVCSNTLHNTGTGFTLLVGKSNMLNIGGFFYLDNESTDLLFTLRIDITSGVFTPVVNNLTFVRIA